MEAYKILRYIVIGSETLSFVIGLYYSIQKPIKYSKVFAIYLGIVSAMEITGLYLVETKQWDFNAALYKFLAFPFQFFFLFWLLLKNIEAKRYKFLLQISVLLYLSAWIIENEFISKQKHGWMSLSFTVGSLILIILLFMYFIKLVKSDDILKFYKKQSFWVGLGILIYYLGSFPFYGMFNYIYLKSPNLHLIYFQIVLVLATTMYLLFVASFIWGKEN